MKYLDEGRIGGQNANIPGLPESITRLNSDGTEEVLPWKKLPWVVSICENNHVFPTRIPANSLVEWPSNWTRHCPQCDTTNWRVDTDFDYVSAIVDQNDVDPEARRLLTYIQAAARLAYAGDGERADKVIQAEAVPLLPVITAVRRKAGWKAVAALLFSVLTSCNADVDAKIDVNFVSSWGKFHASYVSSESRLTQEVRSESTTRQQQRLDQRKARKSVNSAHKLFPTRK